MPKHETSIENFADLVVVKEICGSYGGGSKKSILLTVPIGYRAKSNMMSCSFKVFDHGNLVFYGGSFQEAIEKYNNLE